MRTVVPVGKALHCSWMFRVNLGVSWLVPIADYVYDLTFDVCERVASTDPDAPKPQGSFLRRLLFDTTYRTAPPFPVRQTPCVGPGFLCGVCVPCDRDTIPSIEVSSLLGRLAAQRNLTSLALNPLTLNPTLYTMYTEA
jgi:hypothetical protein